MSIIMTRKLESNIGIVALILALSPFTNDFKSIAVSKVFRVEITAYHFYLGYALLFTVFVVTQIYFESFLLNSPNSSRRIKYSGYPKFLLLLYLDVSANRNPQPRFVRVVL